MHVSGQTRILAVLGHPIAHTASPAIHNAAFDALGLNWRYVALDVDPRNLGSALRGLTTAGLVGVNLTVPHKIQVLRYLDSMDSTVKVLGAANTLKFQVRGTKPSIHGCNTDGYGLLKALKEDFEFHPRGKTVAIIGCGGAGRSAAIQLASVGVGKLILINRSRSKAIAIARRIRALKPPSRPGGGRTICVFTPEPCDMVIQATSLGLKTSDPLPLTSQQLWQLAPRFFFDMIYRPAETPVMRLARKMGCRTVNGLGMLLHQGAKAFEIWTSRKAPVEVMRRALKREIYGT